jgi:secondary thiamine-phosphate synthase enzyme
MKKILSYNTKSKNQVIPITKDIEKVVRANKVDSGTLIAYTLHTTLGLFIQETIEPHLCKDIIDQLTKIVDNDGTKYHHRCAHNPKAICKTDATNGPSHVRQLLINQNLVIDIENGKLNLGTFQDIGILELDGPRNNRKIFVKVIKDNHGSQRGAGRF